MEYRVIKENDLFLLTDTLGNIPENHSYGLGLYKQDTRFLSKLEIDINGAAPILLSSEAEENYISTMLLTNPHMEKDGELILWRESVEIERKRFIFEDVLYETISLKNYFPKQVDFSFGITFDADFKDMFIVRGFQSGKVGTKQDNKIDGNSIAYNYQGADGVYRSTVVKWNEEAASVSQDGKISFVCSLQHGETRKITFTVDPQIGEMTEGKKLHDPASALLSLQQSYEHWQGSISKFESDYEPLNVLVNRGVMDLRVLLTDLGQGQFPVAGLPWFGVPFGRDSLIAALQMLAFNPDVARGTLLTLAEQQGKNLDPWRDEQPGKIMHEIRFGELANTGQIPFTPYYGTIDATPLFLMLLTQYVKWTNDLEIVVKLQKNITDALTWIDSYGDRDEDLFVEYHQESSKGIANQGWKDSGDSIVHRNGEYAKSPIALSEVQGYVYDAKSGIADIYEHIGKMDEAEQLRLEAQKLKEKFEEEFWMEEQQYYATALDQDKNQVGTITSNPGHVLFSGMLSKKGEDAVSKMLLSPKMFSGYGIRTMGEGEAGYNPMSYHDGSIWPHDNSMILLGLSKIGRTEETKTVIKGLIDASAHFEYGRLPELFCGYSKASGKAVKYPVACSPQAWAAGTPLVFAQSLLGLFPDSLKKEVHLSPILLDEMNQFTIHDISVAGGHLTIEVKRNDQEISTRILKNTTGFTIILH
ncbi:glycogen debranching N-terminal domain-containing protein [Actinomycetes bacterium NPDC127524]